MKKFKEEKTMKQMMAYLEEVQNGKIFDFLLISNGEANVYNYQQIGQVALRPGHPFEGSELVWITLDNKSNIRAVSKIRNVEDKGYIKTKIIKTFKVMPL